LFFRFQVLAEKRKKLVGLHALSLKFDNVFFAGSAVENQFPLTLTLSPIGGEGTKMVSAILDLPLHGRGSYRPGPGGFGNPSPPLKERD
jgi:hypothetical protein